MGSKARVVKELMPIILKDRQPHQWFVDMFCGGGSMAQNAGGNVIANDKNKYLVAVFQGLQEGREGMRHIPREMYNRAREEFKAGINEEFDDFDLGWIGLLASFRGKFYGGYSGHNVVESKDYITKAIENVDRQAPYIQDIHFMSNSYEDYVFTEPCIIYCDPPYIGTTGYRVALDFDHEHFWQWCRERTMEGHQVFISEYEAPADFACIWEKQIANTLATGSASVATEKLFTYYIDEYEID